MDQKLILDVMDAVTDRSRTVNGKPMSLADVGYADVGLDDNWRMSAKFWLGKTFTLAINSTRSFSIFS